MSARRLVGTNVNVFIPTTPIRHLAFFCFVQKGLIYMDMNVEEAVKLVVSGV